MTATLFGDCIPIVTGPTTRTVSTVQSEKELTKGGIGVPADGDGVLGSDLESMKWRKPKKVAKSATGRSSQETKTQNVVCCKDPNVMWSNAGE